MIELPRHLRPWAGPLALFPGEIALALGALVERLSNLIGSGTARPAITGEPDGYGGVTRRGPYERLLAGEWALLDTFPEEFLRRVVAGEHVFLERAFRDDRAGKHCVVVFDAGPEQLGGPRIVHIAALILLEQRARTQRATLQWGLLHDPDCTRHDGVSQADVYALLRGRSVHPASARDIERWREATRGTDVSESWFVCGPQLDAAAREYARVISVQDVLEPEAPASVDIRVLRPRSDQEQHARLELPDGPVSARILRDPFSSAQAQKSSGQHARPSVPLDPGAGLVFAPDPRRLYARGVGGSSLLTFTVQNTRDATLLPPAVFTAPGNETIVAAGLGRDRRTVVLTRAEEHVVLHTLSKRGLQSNRAQRFELDSWLRWPVTDESALRPLGVLSPSRACFIGDDGALYEVHELMLRRMEPVDACASSAMNHGLGWCFVRDAHAQVRYVVAKPNGGVEFAPPSQRSRRAVQGDRALWAGPLSEALAYAVEPDLHCVETKHAFELIGVDAAQRAVAVMNWDLARARLIVLNSTRTRLLALGSEGVAVLLTTAAQIARVAVDPAGGKLACVSEAGELRVYLHSDEPRVLRWQTRAPASAEAVE